MAETTEKERIECIIKDKGLSNVEFSSMTGIAPATISHITSGRSKPTLAILKNIVIGFPDLNPEWVFLGTGDMYKDSTVESESVEDDVLVNQSGYPDLFSSLENQNQSKNSPSRLKGQPERKHVEQPRSTEFVSEIKNVVRDTMITMAEQQKRKIVEVLIFFDDGTYEAFNTFKS